ncbi:MAG: hypothetical protein KBD66_00290 [Candidatus Doudnabacteria bacterium]|nr:hypothetical protein [Candidatus Doudnabacteria bacterium]
MQILSEERKNTLQLAWLSFLEAVYAFAPWQRILLVACVVALVPGYWLFRVGVRYVYGWGYQKYHVAARPAFLDPQPLQAAVLTILPVRNAGFMAYAKVSNSNLRISATQFIYTVTFYTAERTSIYQTSGQSYVGPGGEVWVVVPLFTPTETPVTGVLEITNVSWQQKFTIPEVLLTAPDPIRFAEAGGVRLEGVLVNGSSYKLGSARVVVLVEDTNGRVIGVADRAEFSLLPRERRGYVVHIPGVELDGIGRVITVPYTNTSDLSNIQIEANSEVRQDDRPQVR